MKLGDAVALLAPDILRAMYQHLTSSLYTDSDGELIFAVSNAYRFKLPFLQSLIQINWAS